MFVVRLSQIVFNTSVNLFMDSYIYSRIDPIFFYRGGASAFPPNVPHMVSFVCLSVCLITCLSAPGVCVSVSCFDGLSVGLSVGLGSALLWLLGVFHLKIIWGETWRFFQSNIKLGSNDLSSVRSEWMIIFGPSQTSQNCQRNVSHVQTLKVVTN